MVYTINNVLVQSKIKNPVSLSRNIQTKDKWCRYTVNEEILIKLTNGQYLVIPKGYQTDISSVPRLFWSLLPPDGDFALAAIIHDYLYENKMFTRKFNDNEMLKWSKVLNGTIKISLHNIDNYTRFYFVRLFGWIVWNKR